MKTNTDKFFGAVFLLGESDNADELVEDVVSKYYPNTQYHFTLTSSTPTSLPADIQDRMNKQKAALDYETSVLTIYPWAATENILSGRSTDGQIPR